MLFSKQLAKSAFDRASALVLLVISGPLLIGGIVLVKLSSRGPAFFMQERIGLNGRPFRIVKLRTMHIRAEQHALGATTQRDDPRVFVCGRWLRKLKVDELPQLFNVVFGTMSLVGPRPTVRADYLRMTSEQCRRVAVKPGITGLAQVRGNTSLTWPQRIRYDLLYVDRQSIWFDARILFETVVLLFKFSADTHPRGIDEWTDSTSRV